MNTRFDIYVSKMLKKLTKKELIIVLHDSLDYMQQYNGRSIAECIARGMGCEYNPESTNGEFNLITLKEIKENLNW